MHNLHKSPNLPTSAGHTFYARKPTLSTLLYVTFPIRLVFFAAGLAGSWAHADDLPHWTSSKDGQILIDSAGQLEWQRCVEGQQWAQSRCAGEPTLLSWTQAATLINKRNQDSGKKCRLPSVGELQNLVHSGAFAADQKTLLFPPAANDLRWTGTRIFSFEKGNQYNYANIVLGRKSDTTPQLDLAHAWAVNLTTGEARKDVHKRTQIPVQFVCPSVKSFVK